MKTIISLALAGLMPFSALLCNLGISPGESNADISASSVEIAAASSSSVTEEPDSMEKDNSDENEASVAPYPSDSEASESTDSSSNTTLEASSLPVENTPPASSTVNILPESEAVSGDAERTSEETSFSKAVVSEEYALLLASNQASSILGHMGLINDSTCVTTGAVFALNDYAADTEEESYALLWEALNHAIEELAGEGCTAGYCSYENGVITLYK